MSEPSVSLTHPVPYYAQWESAALVPDIIAGTRSAADDPLWQKSGAASREEYAFWSWRLCGMACLRMALEHWCGTAPPAVTLAEECVEAGAYVRHPDRVDGLIYAPFAAYARRRWGLFAESRPRLPAEELPEHLAAGRLAMLSVHPSLRTLDPRPPHRGGHLVLAVGATPDHLLVHNPSGFPDGSQRFAEVPWTDLGRFYAERGVLLGPGERRS
ncbi:C39 family peptidase [Streptomyces sp. PSAA01]|uniref:C39 family peptidase n=1 Tax=Streptomyces sp. PSAA01 TaxID=2912762 RepID=UPI001F454F1C|nr:C39 family peptidase [Streptomyces sp. PSAA01]MCG0285028.1 C39 family peptidase [Streptomyces sp. PSAA01]